MSTGEERSDHYRLPDGALEKATIDRKGQQNWNVIEQRAQELERELEEQGSRPHDEFDDPDEGGEA